MMRMFLNPTLNRFRVLAFICATVLFLFDKNWQAAVILTVYLTVELLAYLEDEHTFYSIDQRNRSNKG